MTAAGLVMLSEELKQEILHYILHPAEQPHGMREQVQVFLYDRLGISSYDHFWPVEWGRSYRWVFCFNSNGQLAPYPLNKTPYEAKRGLTMLRIAVSRRGPYVSAKSYVMTRARDADRTSRFEEEHPASPKAVELAQQVARQFGLTYIDAEDLYAWELDESVADAADVDCQDEGWDTPNAFILLF